MRSEDTSWRDGSTAHVPTVELHDDPELGRSRLVLSGRVTAASATAFHRAALVAARAAGRVVVDGAAAESLDTSAVQILLALRREVERGGRSFKLVGVADALLADLRLAGDW